MARQQTSRAQGIDDVALLAASMTVDEELAVLAVREG
jgi:hypothetical protein